MGSGSRGRWSAIASGDVSVLYTVLRITASLWTFVLCALGCMWITTLDLNTFQRTSLWTTIALGAVGLNVLYWQR